MTASANPHRHLLTGFRASSAPLRLRNAHEDPTPAPAADGAPAGGQAPPEADSAPADQQDGDDDAASGRGSKAAVLEDLAKERDRRRKAAAEAAAEKRRADELARKVAEFEDRDKTATERAEAEAKRASERADALQRRAVAAEIRAAAIAAGFADPTDAVDALAGDATRFVAGDDIDADAVQTALADLLERKPHWKRPDPAPADTGQAKPPQAKPDRGQGADRPPPPPPSWEDPKALAAEAAKFGVRF